MRQRLDTESDDDLHDRSTGASPRRASDESVGDPLDGPGRPEFASGRSERLREWVEWFGLTRLVTSAVAVVVVCAGAWFLVRTPPAPTEASLPMAVSTSVAPGSASSLPVDAVADTSTSLPSGPFAVHVAGAVAVPGVYELESGSRVDDAVRRAGGPTATADPGQLNLASVLADGERIYVPEVGEEVPVSVGPVGTVVDSVLTGPVDVNRADVAELDRLPGVGPATATAIVTERDLNGPFVSVADLERVPGIGPAKLAALADLVTT